MGRGGKRTGAGRKPKFNYLDKAVIGSECDYRARKIAWNTLEQKIDKRIRAVVKRQGDIFNLNRYFSLTRKRNKSQLNKDDIDLILGNADWRARTLSYMASIGEDIDESNIPDFTLEIIEDAATELKFRRSKLTIHQGDDIPEVVDSTDSVSENKNRVARHWTSKLPYGYRKKVIADVSVWASEYFSVHVTERMVDSIWKWHRTELLKNTKTR